MWINTNQGYLNLDHVVAANPVESQGEQYAIQMYSVAAEAPTEFYQLPDLYPSRAEAKLAIREILKASVIVANSLEDDES